MKIVTYLLFFANILLAIFSSLFASSSRSGVEPALHFSLPNGPQLELLYAHRDVGEIRCFLFGAFQGYLDVDIINDLYKEKAAVKVHKHNYVRAPRYMVFLPPFESQELAVRRSKELLQLGLDNYVVVGGGYDSSISVGVFENVDSATRHSIRVASLVPDVGVRELPRKGLDYWVSIKVVSVISERDIRLILTENGLNEEFLEISCKSVDS